MSWNASKLHSLVAHFLRVRFPIVLALNKCDIDSSSSFYQRIREELPHESITRTSAAVEWWLQQHSHCIQIKDKKSVVGLSNGPG
jgi:ribosome-binding ATPase YchF (GTP1/OBG family)